MVLDRNPENYFAEIEQAAFEPANMVPGIGPSPDKMLLGRLFSYPDTHRYRIGANYLQLPVNRPKSPVHSYNKDGAMTLRATPATSRCTRPTRYGGPAADPELRRETGLGRRGGEIVRAAYTLHTRGRRLRPARHARARVHVATPTAITWWTTSSATPSTRHPRRFRSG